MYTQLKEKHCDLKLTKIIMTVLSSVEHFFLLLKVLEGEGLWKFNFDDEYSVSLRSM